MDVEPSIAHLGALIAVPARALILGALFDGRSLTASELAMAARVKPATTSSHLAKLVEAKLIVAEKHGRFRYYKLASPQVAEALEPLTNISPHVPVPARVKSKSNEQLVQARLCYDHIAGQLGVLLTDAMLEGGILLPAERDFCLSDKGFRFCVELGLDIEKIEKQRRVFARKCLDWSERRPHLSGALGAALASTFMEKKWVMRAKVGRQLSVTDLGREAFLAKFGVAI